MKKVLSVLFVCLFCFGIMACGDDDDNGGSSFDNKAACEKWVKSIKCGTSFDPAKTVSCSAYGAVTTCDIADYFNCLTTEFKCKDVSGTKVPDTSGWTKCTSKATCK